MKNRSHACAFASLAAKRGLVNNDQQTPGPAQSVAGRLLKRALSVALLSALPCCAGPLNIAPFAQLTVWRDGREQAAQSLAEADKQSSVGLVWDEERDIREVHVRYPQAAPRATAVEYWFKNWPYDPPKMPSVEDPMDDPWQGRWLQADARESCDGRECRYSFAPLSSHENSRANRLPGTDYRRTLKVRLVYAGEHPPVTALEAFSSTAEKEQRMDLEWAATGREGGAVKGWFSVYNGRLVLAEGDGVERNGHFSFNTGTGTRKVKLQVIAALPELPGSNDHTVVSLHARTTDGRDLSFSFYPTDLQRGPIAIPAVGARVLDPQAPESANPKPGKLTVRARLLEEGEQTIERATREIPPLDLWDREWAGLLYLPLAADSSWQKFAFALGGDVYLSKKGMKAKPAELTRLGWSGDRLTWRIGTGEKPYYREDRRVELHPADGYLPIGVQSWAHDGIEYQEEAFVTLTRGPLSPENARRNEQTPAVLMLRLKAINKTSAPKQAVLWLSTQVSSEGSNGVQEPLHIEGSHVMAGDRLRAILQAPPNASVAVRPQAPGTNSAIRVAFDLPPGERAVDFKLPAVTNLTAADVQDLQKLDPPTERERVKNYWRELVRKADRVRVPEPRFNALQHSTIAHIHITATKDPETGLIMLPAASYVYDVYENESCYQLLLLDTLGQADTAASYLEPMLKLQGSKNFPGAQQGPSDSVFHGVKISDQVDYTANGYGLDHGTVLWTLAQHYLYTRDKQWLLRAWPHMQKAIAWIVEQRKATMHQDVHGQRAREYGLLPASQLEDNADWAHWFSINAFAWAGMDLTAEALADLGLPEAQQVKFAAAAYKADLREAVLRAARSAPVTRLQDGTYQPYVPTVPTRRFRLFGPTQMNYYARYGDPNLKPLLRLSADRDTLCGTVLLLILGVFDPHEPIADWILNDWEDNETLSSGMGMNVHGMTDDARWFSQGGMVFQANLINPIPVYLKRHEANAAIRNLYNDFVSCLYPEANAFTEEFHQWGHGSGPFYKSPDEARFLNRLRDALVLEDKDTLWLAPGVPRRWTVSSEGVRVTGGQTFFGPVTYSMHAGQKPKTIEANIQLPVRDPAKKNWLIVRTPSKKIRSVTINGKLWTRMDPAIEGIELPSDPSNLAVTVEY